MNEILEIAPSKFTNYPVELSESEVADFDVRTSCPVCDSKKQITALEIGEDHWDKVIKICQCEDCSHIYYGSSPSQQWMLNYYQNEWMQDSDSNKAEKSIAIKPMYKLADLLAKLEVTPVENPKIFDVGVGGGVLLKGLKARGYNLLHGCEQSSTRYKIVSREFGDTIFNTGYESVKTQETFDIIHSNHVLEHIFDPADYLRWCDAHLSDSGAIVTFVPNAEYESVFGQAFFLPHIHSFTYQSLDAMGKRLGYKTSFWKGCREDEICAIFTRDDKYSSLSDFVRLSEIATKSSEDLLQRLQGPWLEKPANENKPITLTYHIPNLVPSKVTVWRSYARLNRFSALYIKGLREIVRMCHKMQFSLAVRRLPLLLKLISSEEHQVKTLGYITFVKDSSSENAVPRVSYKNKAILMMK